MPELHFINTPITVEYFCDDCNCPVIYKQSNIQGIGPSVSGFRHECPLCDREYVFAVKLPVLQHMKVAPILPSKEMLGDGKDEN